MALAGIVVISIVFVFLGRWQFSRHEARSERNHVIEANYDAAPVPLADLLAPGAALPGELQWRPVEVTGEYLPEKTVLIRNRPHEQAGQAGQVGVSGGDQQNGYLVVVPLRAEDGSVLLVDRGWIPAGNTDASRPDSVPAPPSGEVTVVARLRPSEPTSDRGAPAGQAVRINVPALTEQAGLTDPVVQAYGALVSEDPPAPQTPEAAEAPETGLGINLSYSVQWDSFAIIAYILFGVALVREVRRRDEEAEDDEAEPEDEGPPTLTRATYR
ncbi:hypothetical protein Kisp01_54490 [Kineosporia sp. NBRC 101677]|nr:hypothetical protein Kisp01_54490 [Kineosporia sp. NBRC 101677]